MVTSGQESVLVRSPFDGDRSAIGGDVGIRSAGDGADILGFRSNLFLAAALRDLDCVFAFETVVTSKSVSLLYRPDGQQYTMVQASY